MKQEWVEGFPISPAELEQPYNTEKQWNLVCGLQDGNCLERGETAEGSCTQPYLELVHLLLLGNVEDKLVSLRLSNGRISGIGIAGLSKKKCGATQQGPLFVLKWLV